MRLSQPRIAVDKQRVDALRAVEIPAHIVRDRLAQRPALLVVLTNDKRVERVVRLQTVPVQNLQPRRHLRRARHVVKEHLARRLRKIRRVFLDRRHARAEKRRILAVQILDVRLIVAQRDLHPMQERFAKALLRQAKKHRVVVHLHHIAVVNKIDRQKIPVPCIENKRTHLVLHFHDGRLPGLHVKLFHNVPPKYFMMRRVFHNLWIVRVWKSSV